MKKPVMIHLKSLIEQDGEQSRFEIDTRGHLFQKDGSTFLSYRESAESGYDSSTVLLRLDGETRATISRSGGTRLDIEPGRRNLCAYHTPHGQVLLGLTGGPIRFQRRSGGRGELTLCYELDLNSALLSRNRLFIKIEECSN